MDGKSKILIIRGTGYIGKFIVEASAAAGHPTFLLIRDSTLSTTAPPKSDLIHIFRNLGVSFLLGDLYDHESLVKAIKQVDVVISTLGYAQLNDQHNILAAIKETGNIKVDYYVSFLRSLEMMSTRDRVVILGDGNAKAVFNSEEDIAAYTIKAVDDPKTLNKILYIKPPANIISMNDLTTLWENKIGKKLERIYVPEDQLLKDIQEATAPLNVRLGISHSVFVKGDQTNFEIESSFGVEASELYSEVKYATVDDMLQQYV